MVSWNNHQIILFETPAAHCRWVPLNKTNWSVNGWSLCVVHKNNFNPIYPILKYWFCFYCRSQTRMASSKLYELKIDSGRLSNMAKAMDIMSSTMPELKTRYPPLGRFTIDVRNLKQYIQIYQYGQWLLKLFVSILCVMLMSEYVYKYVHTMLCFIEKTLLSQVSHTNSSHCYQKWILGVAG